VVLVHATGRCEVTDTASRNGTFVNRQRIGQADLHPGDVLGIVDIRFTVEWVGPDGEVLPAHESSDTNFLGELSPTGI
jgi:pSer/pThr/pTyr-binding forkhead associated (FHA) protein